MTRDAAYWDRRRADLLRQMEADEAALQGRLAKVYERHAAELSREIAAYYQRYGEANVIEYRTLLQTLPDEDARLLIERMDEFARKYPQYAHLMPVRESIYRLDMLEGLQESIRMRQFEIGAIEQEELEAHFRRQAMRAANFAAEQMGFGKSFYSINDAIVTATVGAAWAKSGAFSDAIWGNRAKLAAYLIDDFAKGVARGMSYEKLVKQLLERFDRVSRSDAKRLVFTEGTFLFNEAQAQVHQRDFECYRVVCADSRACPVCLDIQREQRERPVRYEDRAPGVNYPPLHPWCRCSAVPVVDDWEGWIDDYVARRGGDSVTHAERMVGEARAREPGVSALLRSLESDLSSLAGFDFRVKGAGSLARKVRTDAVKMFDGDAVASEARAAGMIHDVLRYTFVAPTEGFAAEFRRIRAELEAAGYNMAQVKNTLKYADYDYRGVNTQVACPDGYVFELQFHTPESLDVKERLNHPLYERARLPDTPVEERAELREQMKANSGAIPTPPGIEEVGL